MKKISTWLTAAFLLLLCAIFCLKPAETQAASKKMATESNGKYMYYSVQGTIYRIDTNSGKTKKIKSIPNTNWVTDISYYKGYLYFTVDYYYYTMGTDGSKQYVCRMKTNGTGFKKLGAGSDAKIYNGKIYYVRGKIKKNSYSTETLNRGIARMSLNGGSKKNLVSGSSENPKSNPLVVNGRIYYMASGSLCSVNLKGGDKKTHASDVSDLMTDGKNIYYRISTKFHKLTVKTGEDEVILTLAWKRYSSSYLAVLTTPLAVKDGKIYLYNSSDSNYGLKTYTESTGKFKTLKKTSHSVQELHIGSGKYMIIRSYNSSNKYNEVVGRIRTNGKKYKALKKYFRP